MKLRRLQKILLGGTLAVALLFQSAAVKTVYADEEVNGEENAGAEGGEETAGEEGGEAGASAEGEGAAEGEGSGDGSQEGSDGGAAPAAGTIVANNGMYIANSFPDEYMPTGFRKMTVAYQGQNVELASMDASNGMITLAYLTDASGGNGDFYLCDTATAEMSDFVMFDGGNDRFIIVLDPGNIEAPEGFELTALSVNGKSVKAWVYTGESSDDKGDKKKDKDKDKDKDDDEDKDEDKDKDDKGFFGGLFGSIKPVEAYAGELDLGIGSGAGGDEGDSGSGAAPDAGADDPAAEGGGSDADTGGDGGQDNEAADTSDYTAAPVPTGEEPSASEYFLVYAINETGYQGFYLYDSVGQTYIRYVDLGAGSLSKLEAAQKSAKIRLFIIIGLVVLLIVLAIILINMSLSGNRKDDYFDDDDDDYEEMKRRVEKKSKRAPRVSRNDYDDYDDDFDDDYDDDDDMEDVKVYKKTDRRRLAPAQPQRQTQPPQRGQMAPRRKAPSQDIDLDDDFSFDFIKR